MLAESASFARLRPPRIVTSFRSRLTTQTGRCALQLTFTWQLLYPTFLFLKRATRTPRSAPNSSEAGTTAARTFSHLPGQGWACKFLTRLCENTVYQWSNRGKKERRT